MYKNVLEIVTAESLKDMQKKLNQWATASLLVKYDVTPLADSTMLFRVCLKKEATPAK